MDLTANSEKIKFFINKEQSFKLAKWAQWAPIGWSPSLVLIKLFIEELRKRAVGSVCWKPTFWSRYVDIFVIWGHPKNELNIFLNHLNSRFPRIRLTKEIRGSPALTFQNLPVYTKEENILGHTIHSKKTHTNRYLNAITDHRLSQLRMVITTLVTRIRKFSVHS